MALTPIASSNAAPNTTLEWPSENQKPTPSAAFPSPTSLRVVLSMTAMWSASNACRTPSRKAVTPSPTPNTPERPSVKCCGATARRQHTPADHIEQEDEAGDAGEMELVPAFPATGRRPHRLRYRQQVAHNP